MLDANELDAYEEVHVRHLDPRLSRLLADRKIAEAQSRPRPRRQSGQERIRRFKARLGALLITPGQRVAKRKTELA